MIPTTIEYKRRGIVEFLSDVIDTLPTMFCTLTMHKFECRSCNTCVSNHTKEFLNLKDKDSEEATLWLLNKSCGFSKKEKNIIKDHLLKKYFAMVRNIRNA